MGRTKKLLLTLLCIAFAMATCLGISAFAFAEDRAGAGAYGSAEGGLPAVVQTLSETQADPTTDNVDEAVATVRDPDGTITHYTILHDAFFISKNGEAIDNLKSVTDTEDGGAGTVSIKHPHDTDKTLKIGVWLYIYNKSLTVNGNNNTLTAENRGWGLYVLNTTKTEYKVAVNDLTIVSTTSEDGATSGLWPMEVCNGNYDVVLNKVTLDNSGINAGIYGLAGSQAAFSVGGSGSNTKVTIENESVIEAGKLGYAVRALNPVTPLTVDNSTLKGRAALYMQGKLGSLGSQGSTVNIQNGSLLESVASGTLSVGKEEFGTIVFDMGGSTVNVTDSKIVATARRRRASFIITISMLATAIPSMA